jgi:hypothetical protein
MTDFLHRLAARALGTAPVAQPILATIFEPSPGLERIDSPAELSGRDVERQSEITSLASSADVRRATLPEPSQQSHPEGLPPGDSSPSRRSDPVFRKVSGLAAATLPAHVVSEPDSAVVAKIKPPLVGIEPRSVGIEPPLVGIEPPFDGIESSPPPAVTVATRRAEPRSAPPITSIDPRDEPRAESRTVSFLEQAPDELTFAVPLIATQQPANATPADSTQESPWMAPTAVRSRSLRPESQPSVVRVTIGRIDVRAEFPTAVSHDGTARKVRSSALSLDEYLKQRIEGKR